MLKSVSLILAIAGLMMSAGYTLAQEPLLKEPGHSTADHSGHAHTQQTTRAPYAGPLAAPSDVDYVWSEAPDDHVIGAETAPLTMIAYVSVTCPHCSKWFIDEWPAFKAAQIDTGRVRFILREYPTPPNDIARIGFIIANCAPKDQYFDHVVHQMQAQADIFTGLQRGRANIIYGELAKRAGLPNQEALDACFDDPAGVERIDWAIIRATAGGVETVPGFIMNGTLLKLDPTAAHLNQAIMAQLQAAMSVPPPSAPAPRSHISTPPPE